MSSTTYTLCNYGSNALACASKCCENGVCLPGGSTYCDALNGLVKSATSLGIGLIVGVAVAGVAFIVILSVSIYCCVKRCRAKSVVLNHANTTAFVPMNNMQMQQMNMSMQPMNGMNTPVPPPYMADNFGQKSALLGNQGNPYNNYGNNNL